MAEQDRMWLVGARLRSRSKAYVVDHCDVNLRTEAMQGTTKYEGAVDRYVKNNLLEVHVQAAWVWICLSSLQSRSYAACAKRFLTRGLCFGIGNAIFRSQHLRPPPRSTNKNVRFAVPQ